MLKIHANIAASLILVCSAVCGAGCASTERMTCLTPGETGSRKIAIVAMEQHAGIAIRRELIPSAKIPELEELPGLEYIELGWGDAAYYMDPDPGFVLGFEALFLSGGSVIHAAALPALPTREAGTYEIRLSEAGFARMLDFLASSFDRPPGKAASSSGPGWYGASRFFPAKGKFSISRTCNTWVAEALEQGGCRFPAGRPVLLRSLRRALDSASTQDSPNPGAMAEEDL